MADSEWGWVCKIAVWLYLFIPCLPFVCKIMLLRGLRSALSLQPLFLMQNVLKRIFLFTNTSAISKRDSKVHQLLQDLYVWLYSPHSHSLSPLNFKCFGLFDIPIKAQHIWSITTEYIKLSVQFHISDFQLSPTI